MKNKSSRRHDSHPKNIDWQNIHHRLENVRIAVEKEWAPGPEETKAILKARAQLLAQPPVEDVTADHRLEVIEFQLAYETYGVESSFVREVYPLMDLTPLPCTPPFVLGIVNVRGEILSIIDIKKFFDLPENGLTDLNKAIILHSDSMMFGILADFVVGVRSIVTDEIQPPLPTMTGIREEYLIGVTKDRIAILDAAKLLSDRKIVVHETVGG